MGSDVLIRRIRSCVVILTRVCFRSVYGHPLLVGFLCWLYCVYRLFPELFLLLVSSSPVLVTTALLLGTLLSYGELHLSELEEEASEQTKSVSEGIAVIERNAAFDNGKEWKGRYLEDEDSDDEKESEHERGKGKEDVSKDDFGDDGDDDNNKPLIKGTSRMGVFEKWMGEEVGREGARSLEGDDEKEMSRMLGEGSGSGSGHIDEGASHGVMSNMEYERLEADDNHSLGGVVDDPYALNTVYTSFRLSPKREEADDQQEGDSQEENEDVSENESIDDGEEDDGEEDDDVEEEDDDENSSDSESDADESSSPDASMTDIMPLLDELHPLLDEDAPQQAHGGANSTAQRSVDASSSESGEDSDNQEEEEGEDDKEKDAQSNKGDGDKPEITWTEDDQKNLMDMGTSELERNLRLENLIARRRVRKMMSLVDEKNLIDLKSNDLPFNVPHITTLRRNPFDSPIDSHDAMGLPPIPGSAPSLLQPRRNPFDLSYDQNEEKPILTGDNFAQEFIPSQRDIFFRRYESFSVRPMNGGTSRQDVRRRPYFVPERGAAEEAYASIQIQLSEVSESKVSSVPETESVSSASDDEDQKLTEQKKTEIDMGSKDEHDSDHAEYESQSSEDVESVDVEHANIIVNQNEYEIQLGGLQESETRADLTEESSSHVGSGHSEINIRVYAVDDENSDGSSQSSPTVEMQSGHNEISLEMEHVPDDFRQAEAIRSEINLPTEQVEIGSDSSSVTTLSDINEEVPDTVGRKESIDKTGEVIEDESHSTVHSPVGESSYLKIEIPDNPHIREPVYDSSPTPVDGGLLFSSASSDRLPESSEISGSSHLSEGAENKDDDKEQSYEDKNTQQKHVQFHNVEILTDAGQTSESEDRHHLKAEQVLEIKGGSSSSDTDSSEENSVGNNEKDVLQVEHNEVPTSIQNNNEEVVVQDSNAGPYASSDSDFLEDQRDAKTIQVPTPSSEDEDNSQDQHVESKGESSFVSNQKKVQESPATNSTFDRKQEIMESSIVELESVKKSSSDDNTAATIIPEVSVAIPFKNRLIESIKEMRVGGVTSDKVEEFQTPVSARYFDFTSEEFEPSVIHVEEVDDEIEDFKELDEGMLTQLDTVGDFILPSLLFGGRAVVSPENEDLKDVPMSKPDSPLSDIKEFSSETDKLVPSATYAQEKTELEPTSSRSSPNTELLAEEFHAQEHTHNESPKQPLEETPVKSLSKEEKAELEPISSGSSPKSELPKDGFHAQEHDHSDSLTHLPVEKQVKSSSKKSKSHDSSSSSSSSDSD